MRLYKSNLNPAAPSYDGVNSAIMRRLCNNLQKVVLGTTIRIMQTTTIPKAITGSRELIVIPREEYEALLRTVKFQQELDGDLRESLMQVERGEVSSPFNSAKELMRSLKS